jgi:hypothetical protein
MSPRSKLVALCLVGVVGCGWFGEGGRVARQEFGPAALLKKYELFKDQAAALDAKRADIAIYEAQLASAKASLTDVPRKDWPRHEVERISLLELEVAGLKSSYNQLCSSYNSNMAKDNYRFANVGELPPGATQPLPREFRAYVTK